MPRRSLLTPYEVRLHLFQGRKLPARDANGVLDAYVLASLGGAKLRSATARGKPLRSEVQRETSNPQWYETMQTTVWLPPLSLAPELVLSVWDADVGAAARAVRGTVSSSGDDFVGVARLSVRHAVHYSAAADAAPPPQPRWQPLAGRALTAGSGEVLAMMELLPLEEGAIADVGASPLAAAPDVLPSREDPRELAPQSQPATLKVAVLGHRGLQSARQLDHSVVVIGPRRPFVEVDAGRGGGGGGGRRGGGGGGSRSLMRRTSARNTPSVINPSYMEVLEIQLPLPLNSLFLPSVNIRVKDALFGGLRTPTLGTATVGLAGRLPATWPTDGALPWDVASTVTVETWENQRKIPAVGWKAAYLPTDPPTWSSYGQPFKKLNKEARAFELPSNEWEWTSDWQVDTTLNAKDAEGWGCALDFRKPDGDVYELGPEELLDFVRGRRWYRTRTRADEAATAAVAVQRRTSQALTADSAAALAARLGGGAALTIDIENIPSDASTAALGAAMALPGGEADAPADSEKGVELWARLRQRWRVVRSATGASGVVEVLGDQPVLTQLRPPSTSALQRTTSDPQTGLRSVPRWTRRCSRPSAAPSRPEPGRARQADVVARKERGARRRLSRSASPSRRASRPSEGKERLSRRARRRRRRRRRRAPPRRRAGDDDGDV